MIPKSALQQSLDALDEFYKVNSNVEILGIDDSIDIPFEDYLELLDDEINDEI